MSGCQPNETLSLCKHNRAIKFGCWFCQQEETNASPMIEHIQKLEERIIQCEKTISELIDKICAIANFYYKEKNQ